jgi:hypothetical protein
MLYLVSGSLSARELLHRPHEEFVELLKKTVAPSLQLLIQFQCEGTLLAGGFRASSRDLVFILSLPHAESHLMVRNLLVQLPVFGLYEWQVTPLESFKELASEINA